MDDFSMSGRFGFAPDSDLTVHDRCCTVDAIVTGIGAYVFIMLIHLPWAL